MRDATFAKLLYELFHGRRDTWAVQRRKGPEEIVYYRVDGKEITPDVYYQHLTGEETIALYPLRADKTVFFACIDVDLPHFELARRVSDAAPQPNYIEKSRSGNYHIWMFFTEAMPISLLAKACDRAVELGKEQTAAEDEHCGLYPTLPKKKGSMSTLIALPFHHKESETGNTIFVDEHGDPYEDQAAHVKSFKKINRQALEAAASTEALLSDPYIKALYQGTGKKKGDKSASGYDSALCFALAKKGYTKAQISQLLKNRPQVHSLEKEYINRTVEAAFKNAGRNEKVEAIQRQQKAHVVVVDWDDIQDVNYGDFFDDIRKHLIVETTQLTQFEIFYATLVANLKTSGLPVWMLLIGPPGSGKTVPMMGVRNAPYIYMSSSLRPTALISGFGMKGGEDMSLIPKLQGKVLLVKDMSSLLSQNKEVVGEVLGMLRDAYDGHCNRPFGTGVDRTYESRFGFIGAATPDIDVNWGLHQRLGERFLKFRLRNTMDLVYQKIDRVLEGLLQQTKTDNALEELSLGFLKHLIEDEKPLPVLEHRIEIGRLAQLGAILRTSVSRAQYGNEVLAMPEWEEGTRYAMQLGKLALGLAHVRGRETVTMHEVDSIKEIVRGSLDARTERVCQILYTMGKAEVSDVALRVRLPEWTVRSILENLYVARICIKERIGSGRAQWFIEPSLEGQMKTLKLWESNNES